MKLWLAKANLKKKNKKNEVDAQVTKEKKITYLWQIFFNQEVLFLNDWQRWYKAHDNVKNLFKQFVSIKKKTESGMVAIFLPMKKRFLQSKHIQVHKQLQMFFAWYWLKFVNYWSANR